MNPDKSPQNLFNEALERSDAAERARFLDDACGADAALRERVEKLLRAHDEAGGFFSQPSKPPPSAQASGAMALPLTEKPGDKIGRYKLLQQIGEGGCGVVYMAEQEEPVRRRVALKVIKLGMDTKQVIARFEAERQALALMDHPNIAKVLDAGATETGRPFFVMELVRGVKITEFCDQKQLSTNERLELFIAVCQAVQHAHQKGIIHRDLKPSNILVTTVDGVSVPKVIDFGIAKATNNQPLTDLTVFTAFEQFIGTPAYMSPEQAEMSGVDIDTRTDIYSLGVLLYELLTGCTPFEQKELLAAGLDGMRRIIREDEPPRPSGRLSTMAAAALTTTAHHRHTEPPRLVHLVRGDLDWIAMKCLEKDRARRYETANALVMDLQRHLDNEPVLACPPSNVYRFQKAVRRNKLAVGAAVAVTLALLAGLIVSIWFYTREAEAHRRALAAEAEQRRLREVAETTRASETVAREQDVSGSVQFSLGFCYSRIGKWDQARSFLERALALQDQLYGYENLETLQTAKELASVAFSQGRKGEAMARYHKIMDSVKTASGKPQIGPDEKASYRALELWVCRKLAEFSLEEGQLAEAKTFVTQLVKAAEGGELNDVEAGHAWSSAGGLALAEGRLQEALVAYEKETSYYHYHTNLAVQPAWAEGMRGAVYLAMGDYAKAERLITNSLPTLEQRFGASHFRVQRAYRDLVRLYETTGQQEKAVEWNKKLVEVNRTRAKK